MLWYSIPEAAQALGSPQSEVNRMLQENKLRAHLYCQNLSVIAVSKKPEGGEVGGLGWFKYSGPIRVKMDFIKSVIEVGERSLAGQMFRLMQPERVHGWRSDSPYSKFPIGMLSFWDGVEQPEDLSHYPMLYKVEERPTHLSAFANMVTALPKREGMGQIGELIDAWSDLPTDQVTLDLEKVPKVVLGDIVISEAEIQRVRAVATCAPSGPSELPVNPPMQRADLLARLIWRVLRDNGHISAKSIWAILQEEIETGESVYDIDGVLVRIQDDTLTWEDSSRTEKHVNWPAFENRVSRLKQLASNRQRSS